MDQRLEQLKNWLNDKGISYSSIEPASADASFRRYFRITDDDKTRIVMDAPPDKENCQPFIAIAGALLKAGLNVPEVIEQDLEQGFLLLSDLGNTVYLSVLNDENADELYTAAMDALVQMQKNTDADIPPYDEALLQFEMSLFPDWYLGKHLSISLSAQQQQVLQQSFAALVKNSLEQPQVFVHRDYHSRNLMLNNRGETAPGVIDFQDAVTGAVTYDLVSLFKDAYIRWPREQVEKWVKYFYQQASEAGIIADVSFEQFLRWFDLMGLQRHLKVAGIFCRLYYRDGKDGYLKDIPLTMDYIYDVLERYPEYQPLKQLLGEVL